MGKRVLCFIMACLLFLLIIPAGVQAGSIDDLKDELEENQQNQEEIKEAIDANKASIEELQDEINKLNSEIQSVESEILKLNGEIKTIENELNRVMEELNLAVEKKNIQKEKLDERLRVMYMYSDTSYLEILFSAKDFADLITKIDMIQTIAEYDQEVFAELEALEEEINVKKEQIEQERANMETLKNKATAKKRNLDGIRVSREGYQTALKQKKSKLERELNQLESESNSIKNEIINLQTIDDNINEGIYKWPAPGYGRITSPYGYRIHPVLGYRKFHTGIDISVSGRKGVSAIAVGFGEVIQSTYSSGYGNKVTLDLGRDANGNRVSAVYAHLNKRYVKVGDKVSPGTAVGEIGTTGMSTGIHLHFEIRINGETTNPLNYVKP